MKKIILSMFILQVLVSNMYASDSLTVIGKIIDQKGSGVKNATIMSKSNIFAVTDINGQYSITLPKNKVGIDYPNIDLADVHNFKVSIYNLLGQKVFEQNYINTSIQKFSWQGKNQQGKMVSSGLYFAILQIKNQIIAKSKITLVGNMILNQKPFYNFSINPSENHNTLSLLKSTNDYSIRFDVLGENFTNLKNLLVNFTDENSDENCFANHIVVNTYPIGFIEDIDGNVYKTVKIGKQWWMTENLRTTHYQNEDNILNVEETTEWEYSYNDQTGAYCTYDNNDSLAMIYGNLYNWYAVRDNRDIAPEGWRVPSESDWRELEEFLGLDETEISKSGWRGTNAGTKLKSQDSWNSDGNGEDEFGFNALATGCRNNLGYYNSFGHHAYFWTTTAKDNDHVWTRRLSYNIPGICKETKNKTYGYSVRCVNTLPEASFTFSPENGNPDTMFYFDATASYDKEYDTEKLQIRWDWNSDGQWDTDYSIEKIIAHQFQNGGIFKVTLEVKEPTGSKDQYSQKVRVYDRDIQFGTVTDIDGNRYKTVKIGDQWWMAENLRVTHFNNQEPISLITDADEYYNQKGAAYSIYNNAEDLGSKYGYLYNYYAVKDERGLAPEGWHVASDEDWKELEEFLGMAQDEIDNLDYRGNNQALKLKSIKDWIYDSNGTDDYGFNAYPAGALGYGGQFESFGHYAYFWTFTTNRGLIRRFSKNNDQIYRQYRNYDSGYSVRCVKDTE